MWGSIPFGVDCEETGQSQTCTDTPTTNPFPHLTRRGARQGLVLQMVGFNDKLKAPDGAWRRIDMAADACVRSNAPSKPPPKSPPPLPSKPPRPATHKYIKRRRPPPPRALPHPPTLPLSHQQPSLSKTTH